MVLDSCEITMFEAIAKKMKASPFPKEENNRISVAHTDRKKEKKGFFPNFGSIQRNAVFFAVVCWTCTK